MIPYSLGSTTRAPEGKEHILLPGDARHPAPLRFLVCGMNERGLGKEEGLRECYVTESKGRWEISATAKRKIRMKSKKNNNTLI